MRHDEDFLKGGRNPASNRAIFLTEGRVTPNLPPPVQGLRAFGRSATKVRKDVMKVTNSIKALKKRHADCKVVRRKGRTYVINKTNPRYKARQG